MVNEELAAARSLDRLIAEDGPLRPQQAARVGEQLAGALACAHAAGVLHRDVKPASVLIGRDDRAVLTDFGIGMVVGTPGFTAPERIRGEPATAASDLWSLGATLYTAVEGRGPFERPGGSAATIAATIAAMAAADAPRAPSAGALGAVIGALLRPDPAERPDVATATRMLADAAAEAQTGSVPSGFHVPGGGLEFADVREFPPLPPPADLPASTDLPEFLDQSVLLDLSTGAPSPPASGATRSRPRRRPRVLVAALTALPRRKRCSCGRCAPSRH
jgi:eukaryotic-like serine/threonine-protein kinase